MIAQFGKIIRIDTRQIRAAGRATWASSSSTWNKLTNLREADKVAAAMVIPPEDPKTHGSEGGTLLQ